MISRNDPCWCGSQKKWKKCHYPENSLPSKNDSQTSFGSLYQEYKRKYDIILKTPEQIEGIRKACHLTARILDETCKRAVAGVTTNELNTFAHSEIQKQGAHSACLGYGEPPYPKSICTSLNEVICHGIPDDKPLIEGDILNIDVSCILNGYYGDCSRMVMIGKVDPERQKVVEVSLECLTKSIAILKPGLPIYKIGAVIEEHARLNGCSVVNQFVGHGVGIEFHEAPEVPHHLNNSAIPLAPGMTFTIEPMINAGTRKGYVDAKDQWTVRTNDGKPSAQWEHTLLITENGCEILTPFGHY